MIGLGLGLSVGARSSGAVSQRYMVFVADSESSAYLDDLSYWRVVPSSEVAAFESSNFSDLVTVSLIPASSLPTANDICFVGGTFGTLYGGSGIVCASLTVATIEGVAATTEGAISSVLDLDITGNLIIGRSGAFLPMFDSMTGFVTGNVTLYYPATLFDLGYSGSYTILDEPTPRTLFHDASTSDLSILSAWFEDGSYTVPATALPISIDNCYMGIGDYSNVAGNLVCNTLETYTTFITGVYGEVHAQTINVNGDFVSFYATGLLGSINITGEGTECSSVDPYSNVNLLGASSSFTGECISCFLSGNFTTFAGTANYVSVSGGSDSVVAGTVNGAVDISGSSSSLAGACGVLTIYGNYGKADYGSTTTGTNLYGESSYAEYGSTCNGPMYLFGANSYLASGANIYGDVYYDPNVTSDPSTSGANITGTIYTI